MRRRILSVTDHAVILDRGAVVHADRSAALAADVATLEHYLGVAGRKRGHRGSRSPLA